MKKFKNLKLKLEAKYKNELTHKKKRILEEINEIKSYVYDEKCMKKIKISKLALYNKALQEKERINLEKAEKLEKTLYLMESTQELNDKEKKNCKSNVNLGDISYNTFEKSQNMQNSVNFSKNRGNVSPEKVGDKDIQAGNSSAEDNVKPPLLLKDKKASMRSFLSPQSNHSGSKTNLYDTTPNLSAINKKLKEFTSLSIIPDKLIHTNTKKPDISLIIKEEDNHMRSTTLKDDLNAIKLSYLQNLRDDRNFGRIIISPADKQPKDVKDNVIYKAQHNKPVEVTKQHPEIETGFAAFNPNLKSTSKSVEHKPKHYIIPPPEDQIFKSKKVLYSESLSVPEDQPKIMKNYGNYLINKIETENKNKMLYDVNVKKQRKFISNIFSNSKETDHGLLELLIELWKKLDIGYEQRYKILSKLVTK